jgi:hypothetical protein
MTFFILILLVLNIEAVTNILSKSEIFKPLRAFLFNHSSNRVMRFLHDLLDCPYCTSVWVSLFYITMLYLVEVYALSSVFVFVMLVIAFHRMANILHHIIDRVDRTPGYDVLVDKENDK